MSSSLNMSAGEFFDVIWPIASFISALLSMWVLASARKRFRLYFALAVAVATLFLPLIVFPIYLVIMLYRKPNHAPRKWRYALPLGYGAIVIVAFAWEYLGRG